MNRFYFGESESSDSGDDNLPYPKPLARSVFLEPNFDPTTFLSSLHNRHQTLEDLRAELRSRSQELNKELLDLVNENYQDFLSLGGSLQGGEERVGEVKMGLLSFQRDVEGLKSKVGQRRNEVEALVAERTAIHKDIYIGRMLLEIDQRLSDLEGSLLLAPLKSVEPGKVTDHIDSSDSEEDNGGTQGVSISRLQRHAQQYVYTVRLTNKAGTDHPFVSRQQHRMLKLKNTILLDLSTALKKAKVLPGANAERILKLLELYKDMGEIGEATKILKDGRMT